MLFSWDKIFAIFNDCEWLGDNIISTIGLGIMIAVLPLDLGYILTVYLRFCSRQLWTEVLTLVNFEAGRFPIHDEWFTWATCFQNR